MTHYHRADDHHHHDMDGSIPPTKTEYHFGEFHTFLSLRASPSSRQVPVASCRRSSRSPRVEQLPTVHLWRQRLFRIETADVVKDKKRATTARRRDPVDARDATRREANIARGSPVSRSIHFVNKYADNVCFNPSIPLHSKHHKFNYVIVNNDQNIKFSIRITSLFLKMTDFIRPPTSLSNRQRSGGLSPGPGRDRDGLGTWPRAHGLDNSERGVARRRRRRRRASRRLHTYIPNGSLHSTRKISWKLHRNFHKLNRKYSKQRK